MGKNHQLKKKKKAEKAKVQIKTKTKFLPKGQNVTNTAFKIKSIVIPKQLEKKDAEKTVLSTRKLTIPELITRLKHYNDNQKIDACTQLEELIKHHRHQDYHTYLSSIIQNVSLLMQDRERKVRRAAVKLLELLVKSIPPVILEPFYNYIVTNLKCAMTNIDRGVQEDSLLVLDVTLTGEAVILSKNFDRIFPDFLGLISKLRSESGGEQRTLSVNLGIKSTNVRWRVRVLGRLETMLSALLKTVKGPKKNLLSQDIQVSSYHPVYKRQWNIEIRKADDSTNVTDMSLAPTLIPLLHESWLEVMPNRPVKKTDELTYLTDEAAAIFGCTVRIVYLLHKLLEKNGNMSLVFDTEDSAKFLQSLLSCFPYARRQCGGELSKELSKVLTVGDDPKCVLENLYICHYAYVIRPKRMRGSKESVLTFVKRCLQPSVNYLSKDNCHVFLEILGELLKTVKGRDLYDQLLDFYAIPKMPEALRKSLLVFLTSSGLSSAKYTEFTRTLVDSLHQTDRLSPDVTAVILKLTREGDTDVVQAIRQHFPAILSKAKSDDVSMVTSQLVWTCYYAGCCQIYRREIESFIEEFCHLSIGKCLKAVLDACCDYEVDKSTSDQNRNCT